LLGSADLEWKVCTGKGNSEVRARTGQEGRGE
jgi:hypothetical protein